MIKDNEFDSKILDTIKSKKLKPKAKWTFLLKNYVIWIFGILSLLFGSIAMAVVIYLINNNDWDLYSEFSGSLLGFIFLTMPYFWLIFLGIFIFVIGYNIKHTKKGYKISLPILLFLSIFVSAIFGVIFFNVGLGQAIDDVLGEQVSFYGTVINPRARLWYNPREGHLMGVITERTTNQQFKLQDIRKNTWLIDISRLKNNFDERINSGCAVKMTGQVSGNNYFMVERIYIHNGPGRGMLRRRASFMKGNCPMMRH